VPPIRTCIIPNLLYRADQESPVFGILAGYPKARVDLVPAFHIAILHPPSAARHNANLEHRIRTWPRAQPWIRFKPLDCIVNNPKQRATGRYVDMYLA